MLIKILMHRMANIKHTTGNVRFKRNFEARLWTIVDVEDQ